MKIRTGDRLHGPAGIAVEVLRSGRPARPEWAATVAQWFLDCPGQSPGWRHFVLSVIHLRPIDGVPPAHVNVPGATHEVILYALDPRAKPRATRRQSWQMLRPLNVVEQVQVPDDGAAADLLRLAAQAVVDGVLPAEPPLSGQVEPWRTALIKTATHARGEDHAP